MAGAGLVAIKRRMKSIQNTRKITKAMGLVATSKLRKARVSLIRAQDYSKRYENIFEDIKKSFQGKTIFTNGNGSENKLYVVFTSDTGLCGGFNVAIVSKVNEIAHDNKENNLVMVVGQKGRGYFNRLKYKTAAEYVELSDIPTIKESAEISRKIIDLYLNKEIGEVNLVYTNFISSVKQEVEVKKILPVKTDENAFNESNIFEPALESCFDEHVKEYIKQNIFYTLANSKASEHASRMNAMDGASKNANDLLDKLSLKYNRIRQSSITQEISEIVGGAEAQK